MDEFAELIARTLEKITWEKMLEEDLIEKCLFIKNGDLVSYGPIIEINSNSENIIFVREWITGSGPESGARNNVVKVSRSEILYLTVFKTFHWETEFGKFHITSKKMLRNIQESKKVY